MERSEWQGIRDLYACIYVVSAIEKAIVLILWNENLVIQSNFLSLVVM